MTALQKMELSQFLTLPRCLVVLVPLGVRPENCTTVLLSKLTLLKRKVLVIGEAPEPSVEASSAEASVRYLQYCQASALTNLRDSLIVVSNLKALHRLVGSSKVGTWVRNSNSVLLLASFGLAVSSLSSLPEHSTCYCSFADAGFSVEYKLHTSQMTEFQDFLYGQRLLEDAGSSSSIYEDGFQRSQQICNVAYPPSTQKELDRASSLRGDRPPRSLEIPSMEEIFSRHDIKTLLSQAPKLQELTMLLALNSRKRHVIVTRYQKVYGAELLARILSDPSFGFDVSVCDRNLSYDATIQLLERINSDDRPRILITTVDLPIAPRNFHQLHFLDGLYSVGKSVQSTLVQHENYSAGAPRLEVHFHTCDRQDGAWSIDSEYYQQFREGLNRKAELWDRLRKSARPLVVNGPSLELLPAAEN